MQSKLVYCILFLILIVWDYHMLIDDNRRTLFEKILLILLLIMNTIYIIMQIGKFIIKML
jgi:hypothetical protein